MTRRIRIALTILAAPALLGPRALDATAATAHSTAARNAAFIGRMHAQAFDKTLNQCRTDFNTMQTARSGYSQGTVSADDVLYYAQTAESSCDGARLRWQGNYEPVPVPLNTSASVMRLTGYWDTIYTDMWVVARIVATGGADMSGYNPVPAIQYNERTIVATARQARALELHIYEAWHINGIVP